MDEATRQQLLILLRHPEGFSDIISTWENLNRNQMLWDTLKNSEEILKTRALPEKEEKWLKSNLQMLKQQLMLWLEKVNEALTLLK